MSALLAIAPEAVNSRTPGSGSAMPSNKLPVKEMPLPGEGRGDYLAVDVAGNRLFVTHTTAVHVLDLRTLKPVAEVTGLTYAHGVAVDGAGRGYVTDGNSNSVIVFDPASGRELKRIAVGEKPDSIL